MIERYFRPDLDSIEVCNWLLGGAKTYEDQSYLTDGDIEGEYTQSDKRAIQGAAGDSELVMCTFKERTHEVRYRDTDRDFAKLKSVRGTQHRVRLDVIAVLLLRNGLGEEHRRIVEAAFSGFAVDSNSLGRDLARVEGELAQQGIAADDYYVKLTFGLELLGSKVVFDSEPDLAGVLNEERGRYEIVEVSELDSCKYPDHVIDDDDLVEVNDPDDQGEIDHAIEQAADQRAAEKDCAGLVTRNTRIGTLYQWPEWKTEWENKEIRVGRCRIMKTKIPVTYTRQGKRVLFGYTSSPRDGEIYLRKSLEACVKSAAVTTGVLALLTGGMSFAVAAAAWSSAFLECMKDKVEDGVTCIVHDLVIVTRKTRWEHGI